MRVYDLTYNHKTQSHFMKHMDPYTTLDDLSRTSKVIWIVII